MMGQTQFGYMTFPQSRAFKVLESQFMTLPLKELAITWIDFWYSQYNATYNILLEHPN